MRHLVLRKQLTSDSVSTNRLGVVALKSLSDDMESLCLIKECRELESIFGTDFTTEILIDADSTNLRDIKRTILKIDKAQSLEKCALKAPLIEGLRSTRAVKRFPYILRKRSLKTKKLKKVLLPAIPFFLTSGDVQCRQCEISMWSL